MGEVPVRKMAKHDVEAVRAFLKEADKLRDVHHVDEDPHDLAGSDFCEVFSGKERTGHLPPVVLPAIQDGALFYAATVASNQGRQVFLTVYVRTDIPDSQEAVICHVAYNLAELRANEKILPKLFSAVERFAASQARDTLRVCLRHTSFLIHHYLSVSPAYLVDSYSISITRQVLITFKRMLVRDFRGDILDWRQLTEWYLRFSFPRLKETVPKKLGAGIDQYDLSLGQSFDSDQTVQRHQCPVRVRVISMSGECDPGTDIPAPNGSFDLIMMEQDDQALALRYAGRAEVRTRASLEEAVQAVKKFYLRGSDYDPNTNANETIWRRWWDLKSGASSRRGIIVEIDLQSYIDLLQRQAGLSPNADQSFIFLNHGGFAEKVAPGTPVFFFAWDAKPDDGSDIGSICAAGTLFVSQKFTLTDLQKNWETIGKKTIYTEVSFPLQYFKGDVTALTIGELRGETFRKASETSTGVPYKKVLQILRMSGSEEGATNISPILPVWSIGNTYLSSGLAKTIEDELKGAIAEDRWFEPPKPQKEAVPPAASAPILQNIFNIYNPTNVNAATQGQITNNLHGVGPTGFFENSPPYNPERHERSTGMSSNTFNMEGAKIGVMNTDIKGPVTNTIDQRTVSTDSLVQQLGHLEQKLIDHPDPEAAKALQLTRDAKSEAARGNEHGAIASLKAGGKILLDVAKEVGASLIVKLITGGVG